MSNEDKEYTITGAELQEIISIIENQPLKFGINVYRILEQVVSRYTPPVKYPENIEE